MFHQKIDGAFQQDHLHCRNFRLWVSKYLARQLVVRLEEVSGRLLRYWDRYHIVQWHPELLDEKYFVLDLLQWVPNLLMGFSSKMDQTTY